jgi:hypothetical protein
MLYNRPKDKGTNLTFHDYQNPSHRLVSVPQSLKNINALNASFRDNITNWTDKDSFRQSPHDTVVAIREHYQISLEFNCIQHE